MATTILVKFFKVLELPAVFEPDSIYIVQDLDDNVASITITSHDGTPFGERLGPQGEQGDPGNTILSGTTVPGSGVGVNGDYYFRTTTTELYGPKTAGAWGSPTSLIGPQGIQGIPGQDGDDSDLNYVHVQLAPSSTWNITHNLGKFPSINVVDSGGAEVLGDILYIDSNSLVATFTAPFGGRAYLN